MFLEVFVINLILFTFFIALLFKREKFAGSLTVVLWLLSFYIPEVISTRTYLVNHFKFHSTFLMSLLPSSYVNYGIVFIFQLEFESGGLNWSTLFVKLHDSGISVGQLMMASLSSSLILIGMIAVYEATNSEKEEQRKIHHVFRYVWRKYIKKQPTNIETELGNRSCDIIQFSDINSCNQLENGRFSLPRNQITVLLGNRSDSSNLLQKTLSSNDFNTHVSSYCSENIEVFDGLTVFDQFILTSLFRGMNFQESQKESTKYINLFNLIPHKNCRIRKLSQELKRQVSLANSFCGDPDIIVLNDPFNGLSLQIKMQLCKVLNDEKKSKTILLAASYNDSIENVADQIVILQNGKISLSGTPSQIKQKLGTGYQLVCSTNESCNRDDITKILIKFVPDIQIQSSSSRHINYSLSDSYLNEFPEILAVLENRKEILGLNDIKIFLLDLGDALSRYVKSFIKLRLIKTRIMLQM